MTQLSLISLIVRDYDEAIAFYVEKLGFALREDTPLTSDKRWVVIAPQNSGTGILLAKAADERQAKFVGDQSGGRVFLFLETDDFSRDHEAYLRQGVLFIEEPRHEAFGIVAVFEDLYGNRWDLIERKR